MSKVTSTLHALRLHHSRLWVDSGIERVKMNLILSNMTQCREKQTVTISYPMNWRNLWKRRYMPPASGTLIQKTLSNLSRFLGKLGQKSCFICKFVSPSQPPQKKRKKEKRKKKWGQKKYKTQVLETTDFKTKPYISHKLGTVKSRKSREFIKVIGAIRVCRLRCT